jgi:AcrR family transcriptional regulator
MLKEHILAIALDLFAQNGIKKVSMDDIARKAGVSKRTLYEFFDDKETLLKSILNANFTRASEYLTKLTEGAYTALEIVLLFNDKLMTKPVWYCNAFYDDIKRYPAAYEHMMQNKKKFLDMAIVLLKKGVKEGLFHPGINFDIVALLARQQMDMSPPSEKFREYSPVEVSNTIFLIFIRGICTDAGWKILERYSVKKYYRKLE